MWRILVYAAGRILAAAVAAVGIAFDVTGQSILGASEDALRAVAAFGAGTFAALTVIREVDLMLRARPSVRFHRISPATNDTTYREIRMHEAGGFTVSYSQRIGHFVRCAFTNNAWAEGDSATAKQLHATVKLLNGKDVMAQWSGRWADLPEPQSASEVWQLNQIDLPPNGQEATLDIGVRFEGDSRFVPWHNAMMLLNRHQPWESYDFESCTVEVVLAAANMGKRRFRLSLRSPADGETATLAPID